MNTLLGPGYVHVYTGTGKGKTTAALGLAFRAAGRGLKSVVLQFLKGEEWTGEREAAERFGSCLEIRPMGRGKVLAPRDITPQDEALAAKALQESIGELRGGNRDVVILDEILTACSLGLVGAGDVLRIMEARPEGVELVLTGRGAPQEVIERADLVTEMREIRHYFRKGVAAREGIER